MMARLLFAALVLLIACSSPPTPVPDADGDGYGADVDCNDADPLINPGAVEVCDLVDNDCDGGIDERLGRLWYADADGDGYGDPTQEVEACAQRDGYVGDDTDCDDGSAPVHPGALETCDGIDENCDGLTDDGGAEVPWYRDGDHDGLGAGEAVLACDQPSGWVADDGDCDDADASVGLEQAFFHDVDGDGHGNPAVTVTACFAPPGYVAVGDDCNDASRTVHPGAPELCNGIDDNCKDGEADLVNLTFYADADQDGYGDPATWVSDCAAPTGYVLDGSDCDDSAPTVHPGAVDTCDGVDQNCSGDESDATGAPMWHTDVDGDGYGASAGTAACVAPPGTVADGTDCDDHAANVHPGAPETCDGVDSNCSAGETDATGAPTWYADGDHDGYGDPAQTVAACTAPSGYVGTAGDCNDAVASVHPGAIDVCNGLDDNCTSGEADAVDASTYYRDADSDGYGNAASHTTACSAPNGYVTDATDCNDASAAINPGAVEVCNGIDDNCAAGEADATDKPTWYADADGDSYGNLSVWVASCDVPTGYVAAALDCDDGNAAIHPGAVDACNGVDDNCSGDELDAIDVKTWYRDLDGDTVGAIASGTTKACAVPAGYDDQSTDCNDAVAAIHPGASETCNGVDNNCSGDELDATDGLTWYVDQDGDGYGVATTTMKACTRPTGYDDDALDCNDASAAINPGAVEVCDGIDNNCDGLEKQIKALYFDSANDTVTLGTAGLGLGTTFTVEAWVYRVGAGGAILEKWRGGYEDKTFAIDGGGGILGYAYVGYYGASDPRNDISGATDPVTVPSNAWTHVAWVYTGTSTNYYIGGVLVASLADSGDPADSTGIAQIGGIYRDSAQQPPMMGYIAEVRVSSIARYASSFSPAPVLSTDANTLGLWHLDEGSGTLADDVSSANHDGTIANATWQSVVCRR